MGLRDVGALEKSQPINSMASVAGAQQEASPLSGTAHDGRGGHQFLKQGQ